MLAAKQVKAGSNELVLNRFSDEQAKASTGAMRRLLRRPAHTRFAEALVRRIPWLLIVLFVATTLYVLADFIFDAFHPLQSAARALVASALLLTLTPLWS